VRRLSRTQAKYIKLAINATWGGAGVCGLSEVRFSSVPVQARSPQPANAATGVAVDSSLHWRPGREAGSHQVFFGTDQGAVAGGTAAAKTVADHTYTPEALTFGTTYYWKVDEVNPSPVRRRLGYPPPVRAVDDFGAIRTAGRAVFDADRCWSTAAARCRYLTAAGARSAQNHDGGGIHQ
jgi:hypothetical protein